jgi:hypothetical protein
MSRAGHLASRFFSSLRARRVDHADTTWVQLNLSDAEFACWSTLGRADRAESVATARRLVRELGPDTEQRWITTALLHDVGKLDAGLNTLGRAFATVAAGLVSHGRARRWPNRIGRYVGHDDLGAARLKAAGARPEAVAWAAAHHRPDLWPKTGIPLEICRALARADGEDSASTVVRE